MAELKTKPTDSSVEEFLNAIVGEERRADCRTLVKMMKRATRAEPRMWGPSIVGFGDFHYKYDSGREGDWFLAGFSPRKQDLTLYLMGGLMDKQPLLEKLGKHKRGKGCLYLKKLADTDVKVLAALVDESVRKLKAFRPSGVSS
jgi:hypothetical protein